MHAGVPGVEEPADLERLVGRAADLCPVSNALRDNVEINARSEQAASADNTT